MSTDRILAFAIMGSMIAFSLIHLGVSIGIIVPYRQYGDVYRPQIGLASFNLVICIVSFFGGIAGLVSIAVDAKWLGRVVSGISAVLAVFCIASLITALVINAKSFSFANSHFSYHMNNYQNRVDSQGIIDLIQNNGQCCGNNLWIDWARVSLNADAPPLFTTTISSTSTSTTTTTSTSTSTGSTDNVTVSTPLLTVVVNTTSMMTSSNTESSTTSITTLTSSTVITSESTSKTSTMTTGETSVSVPTLTNTINTTTTTTTTMAGDVSDNSTITSAASTSETSSSSSTALTSETSTSSSAALTSETSSSSSTASTSETSSSNSAASTDSSPTQETPSSSTTTPAIPDVTTTNSTSAVSTGEAGAQTSEPTTTTTTTNSEDTSTGTTVASKKRRSFESLRSKRQVSSTNDIFLNFTQTFPVVLPRSCCESNAIFTNNGSGSYCISNANGTVNKYHVRGCAQEIDQIAGSQAMGLGIINSCMIIIAFSSIPILWKIPSA